MRAAAVVLVALVVQLLPTAGTSEPEAAVAEAARLVVLGM
jgi:hypothetical protein